MRLGFRQHFWHFQKKKIREVKSYFKTKARVFWINVKGGSQPVNLRVKHKIQDPLPHLDDVLYLLTCHITAQSGVGSLMESL